jgi:hypothetical protein
VETVNIKLLKEYFQGSYVDIINFYINENDTICVQVYSIEPHVETQKFTDWFEIPITGKQWNNWLIDRRNIRINDIITN